jgi:hypothetical protein
MAQRNKPRERARAPKKATGKRGTPSRKPAPRTRPTTRPEERTFPELGDLKDRVAMRHAKTYADEMHEHEESLGRANIALQAVRTRMEALDATHFSGHGYEFTRTPGEMKFSARKIKRGSKPQETVPSDELHDPEFDTDAEGRPIDDLDPNAEPSEVDEA